MKNRLIIASALAAAIAGPLVVSAQAGPAPEPTFKAEKCYGIAKAGKNDCASTGSQLVRRYFEGECRSARLDLCARGLLRADRQRKHDAEGVKMRSAVATRPVTGQRAERAGIGLRLPHLAEVAAGARSPSWLEVHPENFLANPHAHELLLQIAQRCEIAVAHGRVIGRAVPKAWIASISRGFDGSSMSSIRSSSPATLHGPRIGAKYLNDLLPLPYDDETLRVVAAHVREVQDALGRPYVVENPASYVGFGASTMTEVEFLAELAARTGCGLLCDVSNVHVSAANMGLRRVCLHRRIPGRRRERDPSRRLYTGARRRRRRGPHRHARSADRGIRMGSVRPCAAAVRSAADVDRMGQRPSDPRAVDRRGAARGRSRSHRFARKRAACRRSLICKHRVAHARDHGRRRRRAPQYLVGGAGSARGDSGFTGGTMKRASSPRSATNFPRRRGSRAPMSWPPPRVNTYEPTHRADRASRNTAVVFLSSSRATVAPPRFRICESFADLERAVGDVSIAIDLPPLHVERSREHRTGAPARPQRDAAARPALPALGMGRGRAHDDVPRRFATRKRS